MKKNKLTLAITQIIGLSVFGIQSVSANTSANYSLSKSSVSLKQIENNCTSMREDKNSEVRDDFVCDSQTNERAGGSIIVVDTVAFNTATDGLCSLPEAIENANFDNNSFTDCSPGNGADTIRFSPNLNGLTITATDTLELSSEVTIDGPGADQLTISGDNMTNILNFTNSPNNTATINGLTFIEGSTDSFDSVIVNYGHLTINNSNFNNNNSEYGSTIRNTGSLFLNNVSMDNNESTKRAGAVYHDACATLMQINNSSFTNNRNLGEDRGGGAITNTGPSAIIRNSTFVGNTATNIGGAIYHRFWPLTVLNSTFSNNTANNDGGAIAASFNGALTIINQSTFINNTATLGNGASIYTQQTLSLNNSILAGSNALNECIATTISNNNNNLVEDGSCDENALDQLTGDPMLFDLADNGGSTLSFLPMTGSPVIDSGSLSDCAFFDQRGQARPSDGDGNGSDDCDIGSVEVANPDVIFKSSFESF